MILQRVDVIDAKRVFDKSREVSHVHLGLAGIAVSIRRSFEVGPKRPRCHGQTLARLNGERNARMPFGVAEHARRKAAGREKNREALDVLTARKSQAHLRLEIIASLSCVPAYY